MVRRGSSVDQSFSQPDSDSTKLSSIDSEELTDETGLEDPITLNEALEGPLRAWGKPAGKYFKPFSKKLYKAAEGNILPSSVVSWPPIKAKAAVKRC